MRVQSGPARGDWLYFGGFMIVCLGMSAWFFYDWKIGYLKKNHEEASRVLAPILGSSGKAIPERLGEHPTEIDVLRLKRLGTGTTKELHDAFGPPFATQPGDGGATEYFVSDYGMASATIRNGRVAAGDINWRKWVKTSDEIQQQLYWALVPLALALYAAWRLLRAVTLRVALDDAALTYAGKRIPLESMTRLTDYSPKGWVDLYYQHGGQERKLRIDNQKVAKFDEIVDGLCAARGFPDPRPDPVPPDDSEDVAD